ncbi:MAG: hypothetical protein NT027_09580 [Proteobacteria bacterium]|nr:hypothetical protein [Pseudomonadota bacterium]
MNLKVLVILGGLLLAQTGLSSSLSCHVFKRNDSQNISFGFFNLDPGESKMLELDEVYVFAACSRGNTRPASISCELAPKDSTSFPYIMNTADVSTLYQLRTYAGPASFSYWILCSFKQGDETLPK